MTSENNGKDAVPPNGGAGVTIIHIPRKIAEGAVLLAVLAAAIAFFFSARKLGMPSDHGVGAGTFPAGIAFLLAVCTALAIWQLFRSSGRESVQVKRPMPLLIAFGLVLAFPLLLNLMGYYLLAVPWTLAFAWIARVRSPFLIAVTLITSLVVARFVFEALLGTPLP